MFLSPFFPPNAHLYCAALARRGIRVLSIGDEPPSAQPAALDGVLAEYVFEPNMAKFPALHAATTRLIARHGPFARLDSNSEHWLEWEGRLRDDFGGLRSKLNMSRVFARAGMPSPETVSARVQEDVRELARKHGYPLVMKPDSGSGSVDTFVVDSAAALDAALGRELGGHVAQPFVAGDIVTFDGLTDARGRIVFCTSHAYDSGIMQVRQGGLDGHYYSLRELPPELERLGRLAVAAFDVRERFFHLELFARSDGSYAGLEMNVRPPGGFTPEMMSAACGFNVHDLWAAVISGAPLDDFQYERRYHTAHAGRRASHRYRLNHDQLQRELGDALFSVYAVPDAFAITMGNTAYLLRHSELCALKDAIALVQARAEG